MSTTNWKDRVHHDGSALYLQPDSNFKLGEEVTVRLRTSLDAPIELVMLRTAPDGEQRLVPMQLADTPDKHYRWWEVKFRLAMPINYYRFWLITEEGGFWYNALGLLQHNTTDALDFKIIADYQAPAWVRDVVFYQIFPDRFCDGDSSNNVRDNEYLRRGKPVVARKWGDLPSGHDGNGSIEFFGGDIPGIIEKLDYLQELGVNALYLNPIFLSGSNHKYDVKDYRQVDPHLGGDEALIALRREMDKRDMRLMLDIVPNHCSDDHPWFVEAQSDPNSKAAEFFTFYQHPDEYEAWWGVKTMPKLNYRSDSLRQEMYEGEDAIVRYWMRPPFSIDAWRVDVANMLAKQGESQLGHEVGRGLRQAIKREKADAYLLGEHFHDGTPHLRGDELDASMNYQGFNYPVQYWLIGQDFSRYIKHEQPRRPIPAESMAAQCDLYRASVPWQIFVQQFNQLNSHDTARLLTIFNGDKALLRVAIGLLLTYPGVPCLYYGDEIGLEGGADPDNRRCMEWDSDKWDKDLLHFYQQYIALRKSSEALRYGGFEWLCAEGDSVAFQRETPQERLIVVATRTKQPSDAYLTVPNLASRTVTDVFDPTQKLVIAEGKLPLLGKNGPEIQVWRVNVG